MQLVCWVSFHQYNLAATTAFYDVFFIHLEASIGVVGKIFLNLWSTHSLAFWKNSCNEISEKYLSKTFILESLIKLH